MTIQQMGSFYWVSGWMSLMVLLSGNVSFARKPETTLVIQSLDKKIIYSLRELESRKDLTTVKVENDPAYPGTTRTYSAVPVTPLFESLSVPKDAVLQFRCLDGFSAPISQERVLNQNPKKSIAYLAIEKENEKWPALKPNSPKTAGPFYLIWANPTASHIGREEWPFQLSGFEVKKTLKMSYPDIFPDSKLKENHPVVRGLNVFTKNCFTCHTFNHEGESKLGPDLNLPMNPTEYFTSSALKSFVRNPKNLRTWPDSKMNGFSEDLISSQELDDLVSYLKYMAKRKMKNK